MTPDGKLEDGEVWIGGNPKDNVFRTTVRIKGPWVIIDFYTRVANQWVVDESLQKNGIGFDFDTAKKLATFINHHLSEGVLFPRGHAFSESCECPRCQNAGP